MMQITLPLVIQLKYSFMHIMHDLSIHVRLKYSFMHITSKKKIVIMKQLTSQNLFTLSERVELMGATSPVVTNKDLFTAL